MIGGKGWRREGENGGWAGGMGGWAEVGCGATSGASRERGVWGETLTVVWVSVCWGRGLWVPYGIYL